MSTADAIELGTRAIYHATHRDAYSGGFVTGKAKKKKIAWGEVREMKIFVWSIITFRNITRMFQEMIRRSEKEVSRILSETTR